VTIGGDDLDSVYRLRFGEGEASGKLELWTPIVDFLSRWIPPDGAVLDVACDRGYFIRNVTARERWATDIRDLGGAFDASVRFVQVDGLELSSALPVDHFDVVFMSNYLEHLSSSDAVVRQLDQARRVLKPGGRLIVLQPNIRFVGGAYWDFLDHKVALTDRSLAEAAEVAGFRIERMIPRFLPYTTKSRLPQHPRLVRAYLRFPLAWRLLGKQALLIARRTDDLVP
jgi:SAM-dependent methyltransferase